MTYIKHHIGLPYAMEIIITMCWCIWKERNAWIFKDEDSNVQQCKAVFKSKFALLVHVSMAREYFIVVVSFFVVLSLYILFYSFVFHKKTVMKMHPLVTLRIGALSPTTNAPGSTDVVVEPLTCGTGLTCQWPNVRGSMSTTNWFLRKKNLQIRLQAPTMFLTVLRIFINNHLGAISIR
jgi:hypothetical protein